MAGCRCAEQERAFAFDDLSAVDWLWPHRHGCLWDFLEDDVQDIRLVGVIETATDPGQSQMRGVFRNGQGTFGIAALDALLSMQGYRLVLLDRQRAVLQPTQPEEEETIDRASLVLKLETLFVRCTRGVVLKPLSRRVQ